MASDIQVRLRQVASSTSVATIRKHKVSIDRPEAKGGADLGPMGGELFLAAVGGCFMSNLLAAIAAREADVHSVETEVTGLLAETPARFISLDLAVRASTPDPQQLEKLVEIAERGCIMINTLRGKLDLKVRIAAPAAANSAAEA